MADKKIKQNVIMFFAAGVICLLSMTVISKADIDEYTRLLTVVSLVCAFFFVGSYFAIRIFFLCFKKK